MFRMYKLIDSGALTAEVATKALAKLTAIWHHSWTLPHTAKGPYMKYNKAYKQLHNFLVDNGVIWA